MVVRAVGERDVDPGRNQETGRRDQPAAEEQRRPEAARVADQRPAGRSEDRKEGNRDRKQVSCGLLPRMTPILRRENVRPDCPGL